LIDDEETWLKEMLKSQYSEKSWEDYSDLEDSLLEMKIRVKDMETEVSRVTDSKWAEVLKSMIRELRESNTNLQSKLDYSESVFGKVPIKLI
jgi:L-lactate utilization protein LutC